MKLITYRFRGAEHVGALTGDGAHVAPLPFQDMNQLIAASSLPHLRIMAAQAEEAGAVIPTAQITLLAPIPCPRQDILCLGMNYKAHEAEAARYDADAFTKEKPVAVYFSKRVNEAVAPGGDIPRHAGLVEKLDYEVELAVILGRDAKDVAEDQAEQYILGYTILNDVSARDLQAAHQQWYFGKSLDGFTPMGPWIVTRDAFAWPPKVDIRSYVNGQLRQSNNTALMMTGVGAAISQLSRGVTLKAGTIIATGTPSGVGMAMDPPQFMVPGDVVRCEIDGIGALENPVK